MKIVDTLKKRPFASACMFFTIYLLISFFVGTMVNLAILSLLILTLFILSSNKEKYGLLVVYIIPALIFSCAVSIISFGIGYKNILSYADKKLDCEFTVTKEQNIGEAYSTYQISISKIDGKKVDIDAILEHNGMLDTPLFTKYEGNLSFEELTDYSDENSPNYSFLSKGIVLSAYANTLKTEGKINKVFPIYHFKKINDFFSNTLNKIKDKESNALIQALILGNKSKLSKKTVYNFKILGLSHMLAVSGMHLSILIGSLEKLVGKLYVGKKKRYIIMIFLTLAYMGITGFSPSVKRAALMLIVYYTSFLLSKNSDSVTSLCIALAFICFISPYSVFDVGLWLSFLSTYGIVQVAIPLGEKIKPDEDTGKIKIAFLKLFSMFLYGLIPVMFSLPVIWLSYGETAILSPITNIIFTLPLLALMYVSPISMVFSFFPYLSTLLLSCAELCSKFMLFLSSALADYSPYISINYDFTVYIVMGFVSLLLILSLLSVKNKWLYVASFVVAVTSFCFCLSLHTANTKLQQKILYTNSYDGDAFVVVSQNKVLYCDISGNSYGTFSRAARDMKKCRISSLDGYVLTEYNQNSAENLKNITSSTKLDTIYLPDTYGIIEEDIKEKVKAFAIENKIKTQDYTFNDEHSINFFETKITVNKVKQSTNNKCSEFCISFSNKSNSLHYLSANAPTSIQGAAELSKLINNNEHFIIGCYGEKANVNCDTQFSGKNPVIFVANESVFALYSKVFQNLSMTVISDIFLLFDLTNGTILN